ncbi:hypothetical protein AMTRI_Chr04g183420 [Amborella trichopoda]
MERITILSTYCYDNAEKESGLRCEHERYILKRRLSEPTLEIERQRIKCILRCNIGAFGMLSRILTWYQSNRLIDSDHAFSHHFIFGHDFFLRFHLAQTLHLRYSHRPLDPHLLDLQSHLSLFAFYKNAKAHSFAST